MREDIRKKLLEISDDFVESFGVDFLHPALKLPIVGRVGMNKCSKGLLK